MRIQHNIAALNSYRNLTGNNSAVSKNLEKLSSGYRINRAGDDAAGLAISEKMRAQITGLNTAQKNAQDGVSLVQTAEGALTEVHSMLNRMVELADQSANGTYDNPVDRANLQKEIASLKDEIDRIADSTNFNGINLLDGSLSTSTTTTLSGKETNTNAGVDLKFTFADQLKGNNINVKLENETSGTDAIKATVDANGLITLKMDATKDHSASAIKEALAKANIDAVTEKEDKAKMTSLLASATVTGAGTTGLTGATDFAAATGTPTAAKGKSLTLQIGDTSKDFNQMAVSVGDMHTDALGIADIDISTQVGAQTAVDKIKSAINSVSSTRGDLGAIQNRLEHTINNLSVTAENMTAAESRIRDVDMANEMMAYTKNNILVQSSQAMLAQANQLPQGVLQLLQ
ncbi:flagellin [Dorea amylophila]|uniref:flagellin N-terminal helical domain-containing protein n=1 Tax=Dorea amylophila TaxID=2981789 RepID=UPI0022E09B3A|nr:flagellin [Dorea amylophila]